MLRIWWETVVNGTGAGFAAAHDDAFAQAGEQASGAASRSAGSGNHRAVIRALLAIPDCRPKQPITRCFSVVQKKNGDWPVSLLPAVLGRTR